MLQEIQVRGGVKKGPHPSGGGGGVDFFWNNPLYVAVNFCLLFLGMVMYANEFLTKEKHKLTEIKN